MENSQDSLERRCPRLGGDVTFGYCRTTSDGGQPCWKLLDCWWEHFDVLAYVRSEYSEAAVKKLMAARPKPKITSLMELIEAAKKRTGQTE
jgi:hypothetical protein